MKFAVGIKKSPELVLGAGIVLTGYGVKVTDIKNATVVDKDEVEKRDIYIMLCNSSDEDFERVKNELYHNEWCFGGLTVLT